MTGLWITQHQITNRKVSEPVFTGRTCSIRVELVCTCVSIFQSILQGSKLAHQVPKCICKSYVTQWHSINHLAKDFTSLQYGYRSYMHLHPLWCLKCQNKNQSYTFALIFSVFVFLFLLFQVEHLIIITCGHLIISCDHHQHLSAIMLHTLGVPTYLTHHLDCKVQQSCRGWV